MSDPLVSALGGTEEFLANRALRKAILMSEKAGRETIFADSVEGVLPTLSMAAVFGRRYLIVLPGEKASVEAVQSVKNMAATGSTLLIRVHGSLSDKKNVFLTEVHGAFQTEFNQPSDRRGRHEQSVRFLKQEAATLLKRKDALSDQLAEAIASAVGDDLGTLSYEIHKMAAHARFFGKDEINLACVRALVRGSTDVDLAPLRDALKERNAIKVASSLERIRRAAGTDPVMLLLRAKGGPADLALKWLRTALLLKRGAEASEIAARTGTPEWAVSKDLIPAAKRWGIGPLRALISNLARADRGILLGCPNPWASCESALLIGCLPG